MAYNSGHSGEEVRAGKPCRTCMDFKSWAKQTQQAMADKKQTEDTSPHTRRKDCPLDKDELGRKTWGFLHTMAAYYPEKPTMQQQLDMRSFFNSFAQFYPCEVCATDFRKELESKPPAVQNQQKLSHWLCEMHNSVNLKLGKPAFDCNRVNERWKDGWLDGSCD